MLLGKGMVQRRTLHEWCAWVPLILRFPDGGRQGTVRLGPVSLIDPFPSFLDIAGVSQEDRLPVDGKSLIDLMDDSAAKEWVALSEYHSQGSHAPCFMVREGRYNYVLIHRDEAQLLDLKARPDEWSNLSGRRASKEIESQLRSHILKQFDPDVTDDAVQPSVRKRMLLRRTMKITDTR
jgi:choline-sulfatase